MDMFTGLLVLACAVAYVFAAARVYPYEPKPAKFACQDGCYLSELDRVLPYNKPYYPKGKCEVYECQTSNVTYWYSCGVIAVQPGCRVVQNTSSLYPDCCSKGYLRRNHHNREAHNNRGNLQGFFNRSGVNQ